MKFILKFELSKILKIQLFLSKSQNFEFCELNSNWNKFWSSFKNNSNSKNLNETINLIRIV